MPACCLELLKKGVVLVSIERRDYTVSSFDGVSMYQIVFQLPDNVKEGEVVYLKKVAKGRKTKVNSEGKRILDLADGELVLVEFCNPL